MDSLSLETTECNDDVIDSRVSGFADTTADNAQYFYKVIEPMKEDVKTPEESEVKNPFLEETSKHEKLDEEADENEGIQMQEICKKLETLLSDMSIERKYNVNYGQRGIAVIFNVQTFDPEMQLTNREGTDLDEIYFRELLMDLKFASKNTVVKRNPSLLELQTTLEEVSKMKIHENSDMFLCAVFSHGEKDILYSADKTFHPSMLWENFTDEKCPGLKGKPKIFIIQACRGVKLDPGVQINIHESVSKTLSAPAIETIRLTDGTDSATFPTTGMSKKVPNVPQFLDVQFHGHRRSHSVSESEVSTEAELKPPGNHPRLRKKRGSVPLNVQEMPMDWIKGDEVKIRDETDNTLSKPEDIFSLPHSDPDILIAYSTVDGYYSFRRPTEGSWFIRDLCHTISRQHHASDLVSMLTEVNLKVAAERVSVVRDLGRRDFDKKKQVPCFNSTLTKLLYFTPEAWSTDL